MGYVLCHFLQLLNEPRESKETESALEEPEWALNPQTGSSKPSLYRLQAPQSLNLRALMESPQTQSRYSVVSPIVEEEQFSIESLLKSIEEFQDRTHLETIYQLNRENESRREEINKYKKARAKAELLLREAYETMLLLQDALERYDRGTAAAGKDWLAFWGIYNELEDNLSTQTWI